MIPLAHTCLAVLATLLPLLVSCAGPSPSTNQDTAGFSNQTGPPGSVVILPFENRTSEPAIENRVRQSFYDHFSSKNFQDIELREVDRALEMLAHASGHSWRDLSSAHIGNFFNTDFLIYGSVKRCEKFFLGIYAQIALEVHIKMVEATRGKAVWEKSLVRRSHDGGVPLDPFSIIPATLRSALHMKEGRLVALVDRTTRELSDSIPNPQRPKRLAFYIDIQVASFLEEPRAVQTFESLQQGGFSPRIQKVALGDCVWHRVILGPFYAIEDAEKTMKAIEEHHGFQPILIHHHPGRELPGTQSWMGKGHGPSYTESEISENREDP